MRIAISGHRALDPEVSAFVKQSMSTRLAEIVARDPEIVGISCLADGADQIFAVTVLEHGGTLEVVVPADEYRERLPDDAKPLYDKLLEHATAVQRCDHRESTAEAHMDASVTMVNNADQLFAVWDGEPARSYGGTADVVAYAQQQGVPVTIIWPLGARRS